MRSMWKGTIGYGMAAIPVKAYTATEEHDIELHQMHATDGGRIRQKRVCEVDGEEVPFPEIARGYDEWLGCADVNLGEVHPVDDEANRRADRMLRDELGPQYGALIRQGYLDVPSTLFRNTAYRLRLRRPIEVFKNGRRQPWRLCVVSIERIPPADELLMKYLWLRANEEYVLTTANRVR